MARSGSDISTRIGFSGGEDVKKQLENLARAGEKALGDLKKHFGSGDNPFKGISDGAKEVQRHFDGMAASSMRAGNTTRAALVAAMAGTSNFEGALAKTGVASRNLQFQLTNLSFQVNDVVSGLLGGQDPMRIFAQQAGQIFQIFQTGGGPRVIIGAAVTAIKGLITPSLLAGAAIGALAIGFGVLIARAQSSEQSAKAFDIQLRALGKSSQATGKELEAGAQSLRDVGLNAAEARAAMQKAINEGARPQDATRIVRIAANVSAALGEGKEGIDRFASAAAKGGEELRAYAEKLGLIPKGAKQATEEIKRNAEAIEEQAKANRSFNETLSKRNQSIADEQRKTQQEISDLTRKKGTEQEEIQLASQRRIADINRSTNREINELLLQRNRESAKRQAEFIKKIEEDAQTAAMSSPAMLRRIEEQTKGMARELLTPVGRALQDLGIAWNNLLNNMSQSTIIQGAVKALEGLVNILTTGFKDNTVTTLALVTGGIVALGIAVKVLIPVFGLVVGGVTAIVAGFGALASGATAVAAGMLGIIALIGWPAVLAAGVIALVASFISWRDIISGKTWTDFLATLDAFLRMLGAIATYLGDQFMQMWNSVWEGIKKGFNGVVEWFRSGIENVKRWFTDLGNSISTAIGKAFGAAKGGIIPAQGRATGGPIFGPSGTDRVPIWATAGEFMIRKSSVDYLGVGFMNMINRFPEQISNILSGGKFALGGLIDWQPPAFTDNFAKGGVVSADLAGGSMDRVSVDLTMPDGEVFGDMLTPRTVATKFGRYTRQRHRAAIGRRPSWQA